jgi:hypothetical protein
MTAVIWLALLSSKFATSFSRTDFFRRNCFNAKFEKNKNLFAQQTF